MLTVGQLIKDALQVANAPGFLAQADDELVLILQQLAQSYDFATNQGFVSGTFGSGIAGTVNSANVVAGSGPYQLPADFQSADFGDFFWQNGGINYFPTPYDIRQYDAFVQQPGFTTYPVAWTVDTSVTPNAFYVWPAPSAAYPWFMRYHRLMADIPNADSSTAIPWFPSQSYISMQLKGTMMGYTGDTRQAEFLGDEHGNPSWSAAGILKRFKAKEGNMSNRSVKVKLDPRSFGSKWSSLPSTKVVPW
jgi:hypothetical protein